ncbi:MAG TPA: hypothetical protein ENM98_05405 [Halothiobacillaceae bacterium]|nr:hypothetical protein [Halothiobacillaceae bacterium]
MDDLQANPPLSAHEHQARIEQGRYLLCGVNVTARLGAALGKPGICVCNPGNAKNEGAISSRLATHKMLNVDEPPMNQPAIITESIIQAMTKGQAKIVVNEQEHERKKSAFKNLDSSEATPAPVAETSEQSGAR